MMKTGEKTYLTEHFTLEELTKTGVKGVENRPEGNRRKLMFDIKD